jgi:hypothetical protein
MDQCAKLQARPLARHADEVIVLLRHCQEDVFVRPPGIGAMASTAEYEAQAIRSVGLHMLQLMDQATQSHMSLSTVSTPNSIFSFTCRGMLDYEILAHLYSYIEEQRV